MPAKTIQINRAPVLTLWAAIVAERLGYDRPTALTLGRAVAGLNAYSKGRRLGIFEEPTEKEKPPKKSTTKTVKVTLLNRPVPAVRTPQGLRATTKDRPIEPESVQQYLERSFGDDLPAAQKAMTTLAHAYPPSQLAERAYDLYEEFRPAIPEGTKGWGAKGVLKLDLIRALATSSKSATRRTGKQNRAAA